MIWKLRVSKKVNAKKNLHELKRKKLKWTHKFWIYESRSEPSTRRSIVLPNLNGRSREMSDEFGEGKTNLSNKSGSKKKRKGSKGNYLKVSDLSMKSLKMPSGVLAIVLEIKHSSIKSTELICWLRLDEQSSRTVWEWEKLSPVLLPLTLSEPDES